MKLRRKEEGARSEREWSLGSAPNNAVLVTATRLRFGMNMKVYVRAAARDGQR